MTENKRISDGKLLYRDQEKNVIIGIFQNKNAKKSQYGKVSVSVLRGQYKSTVSFALSEFERLKTLIQRMPQIEKDNGEKAE